MADTYFCWIIALAFLLYAQGNPLQKPTSSQVKRIEIINLSSNENEREISSDADCNSTDYSKGKEKNISCPLSFSTEKIILNCTSKFSYDSDVYKILPNGSALVHGTLELPGHYALQGETLLLCAPEEEDYSHKFLERSFEITLNHVSILVGKIGSGISIIALVAHLITFCVLPSLRNLPGYNLASLSVAFMLGYSFVLIGQIPQVLGLFCVISAILQQNFFLVAFFCMNVLAFDVWRTLRLATEKFLVSSKNIRERQYMWYSLYAWGCPLLISSISVIVDNCSIFPDNIKPYYGRNNVCWMTSKIAKTIFFAAPAFTLFVVNGIFFIRSSWIISSNTMRCTKDQSKQNVRLNYILYVRLGLMMGLTWIISIIALISNSEVVWFIFDLLNSLQGLFLFLLFTCTRKVLKDLRSKTSFKSSTMRQMTLSNSNKVFRY